jgi:hypothetical protein
MRLIAALSLLASLAPAHAEACSCMSQSVEEAMASATAIFEARVVSVVEDGETRVVTFAVTQAWRGVNAEEVVVRTASNSAACGYEFAGGVTYLVYAGGEPEALTVSLCSRTAPLLEASLDRTALGSGTIPVDIVDEPVEPVRPARTEPPARGGCASCTAQRSDPRGLGAMLAFLWLAIAVRRTNRP